jgi:hypothetical protein
MSPLRTPSNLRIDMITHSIVLLYTVYFSFKHMVVPNEKVGKKIFAFLAFVSTIWLLAHRDTYLPFLGYAAIPPSVFKDTMMISNANVETTLDNLNVPDNTRVVFWAAKENTQTQDNPHSAYNDYSNSGITTVKNGKAVVHFYCPGRYKVGPGYTLKRHIHYRMILDNGLVTPVVTKYVTC